MKWLTALIFGAILGVVLPTVIDGKSGVWTGSWANWGTIRHAGGLLFSIPLFLGSAAAARTFFNWHSR